MSEADPQVFVSLVPQLEQWRAFTESLLVATGASDVNTLFATVSMLLRLGGVQVHQAAAPPKFNGRPHILEALQTVLGTGELNLDDIMSGLKERGWEPATTNPRAFVIQVLTENKPTFESVGGLYRVGRPGLPPAKEPSPASLEQRVLAFLSESTEPQRAARVASMLRVDPHDVRETLASLNDRGLVKSRSGNRQLLWEKK